MPLPLSSVVNQGIMFLDCPYAAFVCPFIRIDIVTMISHERFEQSRWSLPCH